MKNPIIISFLLFVGLNGFGQASNSIASDWNLLSDSVRGCTVGGEYKINGIINDDLISYSPTKLMVYFLYLVGE